MQESTSYRGPYIQPIHVRASAAESRVRYLDSVDQSLVLHSIAADLALYPVQL